MRGVTSKKPEKRIEQSAPRPEYGRGTGVPNPIDVEVGGRIRTRRRLLGMNQQALADALDLTFQQVQKYEHGAISPALARGWPCALSALPCATPNRRADSANFGPERDAEGQISGDEPTARDFGSF
jgi:DNA-binding XRE family transcriptional regulator